MIPGQINKVPAHIREAASLMQRVFDRIVEAEKLADPKPEPVDEWEEED